MMRHPASNPKIKPIIHYPDEGCSVVSRSGKIVVSFSASSGQNQVNLLSEAFSYPPANNYKRNMTKKPVDKVNSMNNILVTGSSGTIGTRLCEKLLDLNYSITCVDKKPNQWNNKINKITIIADLCKKDTLLSLSKNFDMVIHLAANARVYNLVVDPSLARDNFEMTFNILEYCRINDIKKFIFSSSREVYGNSGLPIHTENDAYVRNCESPYTASKIGGEALIHAYHQCYGIDFIITRFSNVYGMYDESDRVMPLFIRQTLNNEDLIVFGKEKVLDFTYIDDTVDGIIKCVEHFSREKNSVFNIASGTSISIIDVAEQIIQGLDGKNSIIVKDNRPGEVVQSSINISKAQKKLGYSPKTKIHEGIKKSLDWYTEYFCTK